MTVLLAKKSRRRERAKGAKQFAYPSLVPRTHPSSIVMAQVALHLTARDFTIPQQGNMSASTAQYKDRQFLAVIGDEVFFLSISSCAATG
jgi:hypothetical protein